MKAVLLSKIGPGTASGVAVERCDAERDVSAMGLRQACVWWLTRQKLQSFESSQFLGLIDDQVSMFACGGFFECGEPVIGDKDAAGFRNTKVGVFRADSVEHAREMVRQLISNLLKCQRWMALNLLFRLTVRFSLRQSFRKKLLCRANCLRTIFSMRMSG